GFLLLDHPNDLRLGEAAFPHIVCSFVMKQTLHQTEGRSGGQVRFLRLSGATRHCAAFVRASSVRPRPAG
ncbi:hypothetical protein, partial [Paracoccus gahaiensis]|uniref:hypothetical protein n=1 Tax=Paracoccus gahaiensis TaxID=1706839 RepID=UPI001B7F8852